MLSPVLNCWVTKVGRNYVSITIEYKSMLFFLLIYTACVIREGPRQVGLVCIQGGMREFGHNEEAVGR